MFSKSPNKWLQALVDGIKPVSSLSSATANQQPNKEIILENIANKKIIQIPTYKPELFPDLFGESRFYCLPGFQHWAKICYYGALLGDTTIYNAKDDVFVFEDARYDAIFEIKPLGEEPEIKAYPNATLPYYKDNIDIDQLYGTTFLAGRLLGYPDNDEYVPRMIVAQYASRPIFTDLYFTKYPRTPAEQEEEKYSSVIDYHNHEQILSSPTYVSRVGQRILNEQKSFADWYMENKLKVSPGPFAPSL